MICFGHRGAMGHEPENTLRSIKKALELGAPWIEVDIYLADGHLMVIHDDTLERTTSGRGKVMEKSFEYLRSLDAGKGEKIPTLEEVFDLLDRRAGINVEIKGPGCGKPLADFLERRFAAGWDYGRVLVSSFGHTAIELVRKLNSRILTGALFHEVPADGIATTVRLGAWSINMSMKAVNGKLVQDAHASGLKVLVYTVNEMSDIARMREMGVDGVFSNYPERVLDFTAAGAA